MPNTAVADYAARPGDNINNNKPQSESRRRVHVLRGETAECGAPCKTTKQGVPGNERQNDEMWHHEKRNERLKRHESVLSSGRESCGSKANGE